MYIILYIIIKSNKGLEIKSRITLRKDINL